MKIDVTPEDIKLGVPAECSACPVAIAMGRAGLEFPRVCEVEGIVSWLGLDNERVEVAAPESVQKFVDAFDDDEREGPLPGPFSFELDVDGAEEIR